MPLLTRAFIKTAMVCFALALILGIALALGFTNGFFPAYIHLLVFGWLTQLIFGVVYWMFPILPKPHMRGNDALGWWSYAALNLGLLARIIAEPLQTTHPSLWGGWTLVASAALQFLAGALFVINTWKRVKEK